MTDSSLLYGLRLTRQRWDDIEVDSLGRPAAIVVGGWVILAWGRFGTQIFNGLRPATRFVLVGLYGWLGLTLVLWLIQRWRARVTDQPSNPAGDVLRLLTKVGQAHLPLVFGGLTLQFLQVAPHSPLNTIVGAVIIIWMGGQLVGAVASSERRSLGSVAAPTLLVWALWLATAGWYLEMRLGHLI